MATILLVDDDDSVRGLLSEMLRGMGHEVHLASDGNECLAQLGRRSFDLLITDIVMPEQGGLRTIDGARRQAPELKILAISGGGSLLSSSDYLSLAESLGAHGTLQKPFQREDLRQAVDALVGGKVKKQGQ